MATTRRQAPTADEVAAAFVQIPNTALAVSTENEDDEIEEGNIATRVRAALGGLPGDNVRVKLYRRGQFSRKLEWCQDYPPDEMLNGGDELIRAHWGAGAYELRVTGSAGTIAKMQIDIAARPERVNPATPTHAPAPAVSDALAGVLERMADMQGQILARLSAPAPQPPPAPPPMTMQDMLGMLATARTLFAVPPPPPAAGIGELAQQIRAIRELSDDLSPQKEADPDSPGAMVGGLLSVIKSALDMRNPQQNPAQSAQPFPTLTVPQTMNATDPTQQQTEQSQTASAAEANAGEYLAGIVQGFDAFARENKPPQECAQWLYQVLPDEMIPMLGLPNWMNMLLTAMPALEQHKAYLMAVKPLLDALLKDQS